MAGDDGVDNRGGDGDGAEIQQPAQGADGVAAEPVSWMSLTSLETRLLLWWMNISDFSYHSLTNPTYCIDKGQHSTNLTLVSRNLVNQRLLHLTKKLVFFGYILYPCFVKLFQMYKCLTFFQAQEQMSESEGEDGDDIYIRDMFDEPEIEDHFCELDNERQWQQIIVTADVHVHANVDEARINID